MEKRVKSALPSVEQIPDVAEICPNCGHRGERRKCKLICTNPRCGIHIILACVD